MIMGDIVLTESDLNPVAEGLAKGLKAALNQAGKADSHTAMKMQ
jgi:hypothetical protein